LARGRISTGLSKEIEIQVLPGERPEIDIAGAPGGDRIFTLDALDKGLVAPVQRWSGCYLLVNGRRTVWVHTARQFSEFRIHTAVAETAGRCRPRSASKPCFADST